MMGNFISTFTYPVTILRDLQGQTNFPAAGSPYTRAYYGGTKRSTPIAGERNILEEYGQTYQEFLNRNSAELADIVSSKKYKALEAKALDETADSVFSKSFSNKILSLLLI